MSNLREKAMKYKVKSGTVNAMQLKVDNLDEVKAFIPDEFRCKHRYDLETDNPNGLILWATQIGTLKPNIGDYIFFYENGAVNVMTEEDFHDNYEPAPQNHIERMEVEASELQAKIDGAQKLLDSFQEEDAPLICDEQFDLIEKQLKFMKAYLITLRRRIKFDKEMFKAIGVKD